ncbi:MAG: hypothetical protein D3904_14190 [Candidatus Electrothrix sp. EH2]|nr:hypothetical protein [Candidatus Electrothrix sp. EH2]
MQHGQNKNNRQKKKGCFPRMNFQLKQRHEQYLEVIERKVPGVETPGCYRQSLRDVVARTSRPGEAAKAESSSPSGAE